MPKLNIYLHFDGNCEEAFNYYKRIFKAETANTIRYGDVPQQEGMPAIPEQDLNKIENIGILINKDTVLMGSDNLEIFGQKLVTGNNFSIYIEADDKEQAENIFNGLSDGGFVKMPLTLAHWGDLFGMCTDKFGISWFINFSPGLAK